MLRVETSSGVALALAAAIVCGCSASARPPGGRLTTSQQILATEAIDTALAEVAWPNVDGRSVFVEIGSPSGDAERAYLESAVRASVAERGAKLSSDIKSADYVMVVLGKVIGVDEKRTFIGIPALESAFLPVDVPEIAVYTSNHQKGVASIETVLTDRKRGGVESRSEPVDSEIWVHDSRVLFFNNHETNSQKLDPKKVDPTEPPSAEVQASKPVRKNPPTRVAKGRTN